MKAERLVDGAPNGIIENNPVIFRSRAADQSAQGSAAFQDHIHLLI